MMMKRILLPVSKSNKWTGPLLRSSRFLASKVQPARPQQQQQHLDRELHPAAIACGNQPKLLYLHGQPSATKEKFRQFHELCNQWKLLRTADLGNLSGSRSYVLLGPLAELEQALIRFTVDYILANYTGFQLITVPDLLHPRIIEGCGMDTRGTRTQVYSLENEDEDDGDDETDVDNEDKRVCLSGTAEMGIASYLANRTIPESELPLRFLSVSRCYRAEVSTVEEEAGIFRVHNFTKVEMFAVTTDKDGTSQAMHDELRAIQENLFGKLGLHYQTLEMPADDLGVAAYRKFDIEAWMPGRQQFGEISSTSNCIDNQAKALNIRYQPSNTTADKEPRHVHTVNGTAVAIPRMLIALLETCQTPRGGIELAPVLDPTYIRWKESLEKWPRLTSVFLKSSAQQDRISQDHSSEVLR